MSDVLYKKIDWKTLRPYQKRSFVAEDFQPDDFSQIQPYLEDLAGRAITDSSELVKWINDRSELESVIDQHSSILYIKMTCQTDHEQYAREYKHFISEVAPQIKPFEDKINKKYLDFLKTLSFDDPYYKIYTREIEEDVALFRSENIEIETELSLLSQEYQTIFGAMTVQFDGQEKTLQEMSKYLLDHDRNKRQDAWRSISSRRLKDKDRLDDIFDRMVQHRHHIAQNIGCRTFTEYMFRALHRFDYTAEDCLAYHATIERAVVPLWERILKQRCRQMGVDVLRPWDTACDPLGRPPLKPFEQAQDLIRGCANIFHHVDPELGEQFNSMARAGCLDLDSRIGKAPGGYQSTLNEARKPFIFMNAVGLDQDVRTLLHEGGHAFHALACANEPLLDYRHAPMEFCEVASMSMELLGGEYLDVFYQFEEAQRSVQHHLEDVIYILIWVAIVDAFQHWIYDHPQHTPDQRKQAWLEMLNRFGTSHVDWQGFEEEKAFSWHRQLHIFEVPFYYIEYGIAQLGALQIWMKSKEDFQSAIQSYRTALSFGGSLPLPKLFEAAGIRFDFSEKMILPLVSLVGRRLGFAESMQS
ncbi:MAG: M3 family oligoendopeptidase [Candidatus Omnitrophica bacterium]|nr:M3 family oligoendopeptidase [Candidatus Omnitrophota bacterium]